MDPALLVGLRESVAVEVAGEVYTVRGDLTLRDWIGATMEPLPLLAVLPFREAQMLNRRSYDNEDPVEGVDFLDGWHDALEAATGMKWWSAERLIAVLAGDFPELAGRLLLKGIDPLVSPPDKVLHALLAMALEGMDKKERQKFEADLHKPPMPPPGAAKGTKTPPPGWSAEEEGAAFLAAQSARTTGIRT